MTADPHDGGIRDWLDEYLAPEPRSGSMPDPLDFSALQRREIGFVLVRVRADGLEETHARVRRVVDEVSGRGAGTAAVASTLVIAAFGLHRAEAAVGAKATDLAHDLVERFGEEVAVLFGSGEHLVGTYGGEGHVTFGPFSLGLVEHIGQVLALGWGAAEEARPPDA